MYDVISAMLKRAPRAWATRSTRGILTKLPTAYPEVISTKKKTVSITSKVMILASLENFILKLRM